jgi:hypothetical protein
MASALKFGTLVRNALADALAAVWNSGTLLIYDSAPPADPQTAFSGNLLVTINIPATAFGAASSGVASKAGTWSATVSASGTALGFRMIDSGGTKKMDGNIGLTASSPDMVLDNNVLVSGGTATVSTFTLTQPE